MKNEVLSKQLKATVREMNQAMDQVKRCNIRITEITELLLSGGESVKSEKDFTKYKVADLPAQGKGRTAYAIVKTAVGKNPQMTSQELISMFPPELAMNRKAFKVVVPLQEAKRVNSDQGRNRYFTKPEDVIVLSDGGKYAVSTQWNKTNIGEMLEKARVLQIPIRKVNSR